MHLETAITPISTHTDHGVLVINPYTHLKLTTNIYRNAHLRIFLKTLNEDMD